MFKIGVDELDEESYVNDSYGVGLLLMWSLLLKSNK
jgi:hypothetical protein